MGSLHPFSRTHWDHEPDLRKPLEIKTKRLSGSWRDQGSTESRPTGSFRHTRHLWRYTKADRDHGRGRVKKKETGIIRSLFEFDSDHGPTTRRYRALPVIGIVAGLVVPSSFQTVAAPAKTLVDCSLPPVGVHEIVRLLPDFVAVNLAPPVTGGAFVGFGVTARNVLMDKLSIT